MLTAKREERNGISMKTSRLFLVLLVLLGFAVAPFAEEADQTGEALFKQNCSSCHPDGGNIFNKSKTLSKDDRETNGINTADDIVKKRRNPGALDLSHPNQWCGMKVFDETKLSDRDLRKIAEYILKTFN
jgi:mono/diheme cytochrome c family protein